MPQKSADFYPKLLSGVAIYRLGKIGRLRKAPVQSLSSIFREAKK
jgi:hypothetical protein